jgi:hypothetical protein
VAGFSPDTSYTCSLVASNKYGSGPAANVSFTTPEDYSIFQLRLAIGGVNACSEFTVSLRHQKLENITNAVLEELTDSCSDCGITNDIIDNQQFSCFPESPTYVTFRARLEGTSETDSGSLISLIQEWVSGGTSIIVTGVLMTVDSECSVAISSLSEGECSPTQPPTSSTVTSAVNSTVAASDNTVGAIIGGALAVVLIIASTVVVIVIVLTVIGKRRGKLSFNNIEENTLSKGLKDSSITFPNADFQMTDLGREDAHVNELLSATVAPPTDEGVGVVNDILETQ